MLTLGKNRLGRTRWRSNKLFPIHRIEHHCHTSKTFENSIPMTLTPQNCWPNMTIPAAIIAFLFLGIVNISLSLCQCCRHYLAYEYNEPPHPPVAVLHHFAFNLEKNMNIIQITSSLYLARAEPAELAESFLIASLADEPSRTFRSPRHLAAYNKSRYSSRAQHETPVETRYMRLVGDKVEGEVKQISKHNTKGGPHLPCPWW